jgi:putative nucleotidyltransferase with HDIG domain
LTINADTPDSAAPSQDETRWESRRFAAWTLRAGIVFAPVIAAIVVMAVVSRLVPRPRSGSLLLVAGWWALVLASSLVTLWATDRAARRLTPLAALLDLAVLFPGRAPTRFAIARKAGDLRTLKTLSEKADRGERGDIATAAEQILALVGSLRAHDRHTRGHSERVRVYTDMIAAELRLPTAAVDRLRWAALLHDIGKLRIPATTLNKPAKLSKSEWEAIRQHPDDGAELAADLLPWLSPWGLAIAEHHEHFDGTGYPRGTTGSNISLAGRIVAVADSFETMTAARPYKRARTRAGALEELVRYSGKQFDPDVVRALLAVSAPKLAWAMGPASWLTGLPFIGSAPSLTGAGIAAQAATGVAGVAAASVAGVAVAAVPNNPVPTPQPIAQSAPVVVAAGSPSAAAPAQSVLNSPDPGRITAIPTPGAIVAPPTAVATTAPTPTATAAVTPAANPATSTTAAGPTAKPAPTPTPKKTVTPPPSAKAPVVPPPVAPPKPTPTPTIAPVKPTPTPTPTPTATPTPTPTVTPPAPPTAGSVQVNYRDAGPLILTTQLMPEIEVVNKGTKPIDLGAVTVRYWFTADNSNATLKYTCTFAAAGCGTITGSFVKTGGHDADHYLLLQLSGTLAPGATTGLIQLRITQANLGLFDQSNDYSYGSSMTTQPWTRITAYSNGQLIWGVET